MDPSFALSPAGRLVSTVLGRQAFAPHPLPPTLDYGPHLTLLSEAAGAVGELHGASRRLANPDILLRPLQRSEALSSSEIEGTYSTAADLALLEADETLPASEETREVWNYGRALRFGVAHLEQAEMSQWLIKSIHVRLLQGLQRVEGGAPPGEYKAAQNYIGMRGQRLENARFVPPPPLEAKACMDQLEEYLTDADSFSIPPLIDAALVHYQFEAIHPFDDGNGRVGRIMIPLRLIQRGVTGGSLLYPSPYLADHRDEYIDALYEVSRIGDWARWIEFFLTAMRETARASIKVIDQIINLQAEYHKIARGISRSANLGGLVDLLFERPVVTIPMVSENLSITYRAARQLVERLVEHDMLFEAPGMYPKTFVALKIVRIGRGDGTSG